MSCKLCEAFIHDYFTQPLERENPLYISVNHKKQVQHIPRLVYVMMRISRSISRYTLQDARSNMENYCCFMKKPDNKYEEYEIYYQFLKKNKQLDAELQGATSDILESSFLKLNREDKHVKIIDKWFAFILGSILQEIYDRHDDHSGIRPLWQVDTSKPLPGNHQRPKSAQPRGSSSIVGDSSYTNEDIDEEFNDLYT
jgi:hypothetical protein